MQNVYLIKTFFVFPKTSSILKIDVCVFLFKGIAPNKTTNKPTVLYELIKVPGKNTGDLSEQKLAFRCDFPPVVDGTNIIYYKVFWFINDRTAPIFVSKAVQEHSLHETYLKGENGLNSIKLNIEVRFPFRLFPNDSYFGHFSNNKTYDCFRTKILLKWITQNPRKIVAVGGISKN